MNETQASTVRMINQIADNVGLNLAPEQAASKVVQHIHLYWAISMKNDLIAYYKNDGKLLNNVSQLAANQLAEAT